MVRRSTTIKAAYSQLSAIAWIVDFQPFLPIALQVYLFIFLAALLVVLFEAGRLSSLCLKMVILPTFSPSPHLVPDQHSVPAKGVVVQSVFMRGRCWMTLGLIRRLDDSR